MQEFTVEGETATTWSRTKIRLALITITLTTPLLLVSPPAWTSTFSATSLGLLSSSSTTTSSFFGTTLFAGFSLSRTFVFLQSSVDDFVFGSLGRLGSLDSLSALFGNDQLGFSLFPIQRLFVHLTDFQGLFFFAHAFLVNHSLGLFLHLFQLFQRLLFLPSLGLGHFFDGSGINLHLPFLVFLDHLFGNLHGSSIPPMRLLILHEPIGQMFVVVRPPIIARLFDFSSMFARLND